MNGFSWRRLYALMRKETIQVARDRITLRFIILLPIMQLFLFGFAINTNPKNLPTGLLAAQPSKYERTIVAAMKNTGYYKIQILRSEAEAERDLREGTLLFVVQMPPNFDRAVDRGETPSILVDADATDPTAVGNATGALQGVIPALTRDLPANRRAQLKQNPAFQFVVHARYNPEQLTAFNVVPGLICIVLTFSTLFATTLSITKERERGTMENLLSMPVRPIEIMIAKIVPYVVIGYIQVLLILICSTLMFGLPIQGSVLLLLAALGIFMAANLALGVTISTLSANQMQATQVAQMLIMPSFLLSGFMFPFRGMPGWAQFLGEVFPSTHAMRIVRGILLKGIGFSEIIPELWPMALFAALIISVAVYFYKETLD
jgi:ABC-type multidrug transport system permease subunit